MSDHALRRLTLEHYVARTSTLALVASLADGVEAYDYLHGGGEADLVILDVSTAGPPPTDLPLLAPQAAALRWLLIERMGNIPRFSCAPTDADAAHHAQPLCLGNFSRLVEQTLGAMAA